MWDSGGVALDTSDERDLMHAMMRLYGGDAQSVAADHAETHAKTGEREKSEKWLRIAAALAQMKQQTKSI